MAETITIKKLGKTTDFDTKYGKMSKTYFVDDKDRELYVNTKVGNEPKEGESLEGDIVQDNYGNQQFKKAQKNFGGGGGGRDNTPSIEKQKALGEANITVNNFYTLFPDKRTDIEDLEKYVAKVRSVAKSHLGLLNMEVDAILGTKAPETKAPQATQTAQDNVPTNEEVENFNDDDIQI